MKMCAGILKKKSELIESMEKYFAKTDRLNKKWDWKITYYVCFLIIKDLI